MKILANVFFASPDFSGLTPLVLLVPVFLPLYIVAAFHGGGLWLGLLQFLVIASVEIVQWMRFKRLSVSFRVFATLIIYIVANITSTLGIFLFFR